MVWILPRGVAWMPQSPLTFLFLPLSFFVHEIIALRWAGKKRGPLDFRRGNNNDNDFDVCVGLL